MAYDDTVRLLCSNPGIGHIKTTVSVKVEFLFACPIFFIIFVCNCSKILSFKMWFLAVI